MNIHPLAIVSPHARLGQGTTVGPFSIIEPDVVLGTGCTLAARVVIKNGTTLGDNNSIHEGAVLGGNPQHTGMPERLGRVIIGSHNTFRENITVHRALNEEAATRIGSHNLLMVGAHVAHDCSIGDKVVLARRYLVEENGLDAATIAAIPKNELLPFFEQTVGVDPWQTRDLLWEAYSPQTMWIYFTLIGLASMIGIYVYNVVVTGASRNPLHSFNLHGHRWVSASLLPIALAFWWGTYHLRTGGQDWSELLAVLVQAIIFSGLFLLSLSMKAPEPVPAEQEGA